MLILVLGGESITGLISPASYARTRGDGEGRGEQLDVSRDYWRAMGMGRGCKCATNTRNPRKAQ
ncbi:hypothetical protein [Nitrosomonas sp. Nm34]|uniref:hypothetical protein n=1 Tax=Nitrosomonas sp. Nm34 TaxID=1881055 RepID=UPI001113B19B|nr:hypothetical protein [Nitrosomonas sp. Nm34]